MGGQRVYEQRRFEHDHGFKTKVCTCMESTQFFNYSCGLLAWFLALNCIAETEKRYQRSKDMVCLISIHMSWCVFACKSTVCIWLASIARFDAAIVL
jgi:hypothetical protein